MKESLLYLLDEVSVTRGGADILQNVTLQVRSREMTGLSVETTLGTRACGFHGSRPGEREG